MTFTLDIARLGESVSTNLIHSRYLYIHEERWRHINSSSDYWLAAFYHVYNHEPGKYAPPYLNHSVSSDVWHSYSKKILAYYACEKTILYLNIKYKDKSEYATEFNYIIGLFDGKVDADRFRVEYCDISGEGI